MKTRKTKDNLGRIKRIWYLSPMRAGKVQASLRMRAVSPEPLLLAHTSNESRGTFRQKARSLAPLNGWACTVKIFHDRLLEDTNWLDAAHFEGSPQTFGANLLEISTVIRKVVLKFKFLESYPFLSPKTHPFLSPETHPPHPYYHICLVFSHWNFLWVCKEMIL